MYCSEEHTKCLPQAFADMVRVSNDLLIEALKHGMLVDSISVYGLLVAHNKTDAFPLKYCVNFKPDSCVM